MNTENLLTDLCIIEQKIEGLQKSILSERDERAVNVNWLLDSALSYIRSTKREIELPIR